MSVLTNILIVRYNSQTCTLFPVPFMRGELMTIAPTNHRRRRFLRNMIRAGGLRLHDHLDKVVGQVVDLPEKEERDGRSYQELSPCPEKPASAVEMED